MKFLTTKICKQPSVKNNKYIFSTDGLIMLENDDMSEKQNLFFDRYGLDLYDVDEYLFTPKSFTNLNYYKHDFIPIIISVECYDYNRWLEITQIIPHDNIYKSAKLVFLGYEIIDSGFMSIYYHGTSPVNENKINLLNDFGLFSSKSIADIYLNKNKVDIPEHEWYIVGLYVSNSVYSYFCSKPAV